MCRDMSRHCSDSFALSEFTRWNQENEANNTAAPLSEQPVDPARPSWAAKSFHLPEVQLALVHTSSFTSALHSYISNSSYSRFWQQDASFIFSTLLLNILQFPSSSRLPEALTPSDLLYLPAPPPSIRLPNRSPPPQFSVELDYLADTTNTCSHASVAADGLMATRDGCSSFSLEAGANRCTRTSADLFMFVYRSQGAIITYTLWSQ